MEGQGHIEAYQDLFNYMNKEYGLILIQSEMDEIIRLSQKVSEKYDKGISEATGKGELKLIIWMWSED